MTLVIEELSREMASIDKNGCTKVAVMNTMIKDMKPKEDPKDKTGYNCFMRLKIKSYKIASICLKSR